MAGESEALVKRREKKKKKDGEPISKGKKDKVVDPARVLATKIRDHKDLESRWAVVDENRVEFIRGKDFVALLRAHPELVTDQIQEELDEASLEESVGNLLLQRQLLVRCGRFSTTLRQGRKKLSKFPARLVWHQEQEFVEEEGFYAWTFERPRTIMQTVMAFMLPVFTVLCCLFPVAPHWCKLGVLYLCLTLLGLIFGVLFVRWVVFGVIWLMTGKRVWFFPNILAEETTLEELFRFLPYDPKKDSDPPPKLTTRLLAALLTAGILFVIVRHGPDEHARAKYRKKVGNIIDDVLLWNPAMITGKVTDVPDVNTTNVANETEVTPGDSAPAEPVGHSQEEGVSKEANGGSSEEQSSGGEGS